MNNIKLNKLFIGQIANAQDVARLDENDDRPVRILLHATREPLDIPGGYVLAEVRGDGPPVFFDGVGVQVRDFIPHRPNVEQIARLWLSNQDADSRHKPLFELITDFFFAAWNQYQTEGRIPIASDVAVEGLWRERYFDLWKMVNTPQVDNFMSAVPLEAAFQVEKWGSDHDAGKTPMDFFWLLGYVSQKAAQSLMKFDSSDGTVEDLDKSKHHIITTAAVCLNWFRRVTGEEFAFRPGIDPATSGIAETGVTGGTRTHVETASTTDHGGGVIVDNIPNAKFSDRLLTAYLAATNEANNTGQAQQLRYDTVERMYFFEKDGFDPAREETRGEPIAICYPSRSCNAAVGDEVPKRWPDLSFEAIKADFVSAIPELAALECFDKLSVGGMINETAAIIDSLRIQADIMARLDFRGKLYKTIEAAARLSENTGVSSSLWVYYDTDSPGFHFGDFDLTDRKIPCEIVGVIRPPFDRGRAGYDLPPRGAVMVGLTEAGDDVVINLDRDRTGHIVFSPDEARGLARLLTQKAREVDGSRDDIVDAFAFAFGSRAGESVTDRQDAPAAASRPLDIVIFCPKCSFQHIDAADPYCENCGKLPEEHYAGGPGCDAFKEWTNPPHKTHRCKNCNNTFRPAHVPTNGVAELTKVNNQIGFEIRAGKNAPEVRLFIPATQLKTPPDPLNIIAFCAECSAPLNTSPVWISFPSDGSTGELLNAFCSADCDQVSANRDAFHETHPGPETDHYGRYAKYCPVCYRANPPFIIAATPGDPYPSIDVCSFACKLQYERFAPTVKLWLSDEPPPSFDNSVEGFGPVRVTIEGLLSDLKKRLDKKIDESHGKTLAAFEGLELAFHDTGHNLEIALDLLDRASGTFETSAPDTGWFREYYTLIGQFAICTDEGWEAGEDRTHYLSDPDAIVEFVNKPEDLDCLLCGRRIPMSYDSVIFCDDDCAKERESFDLLNRAFELINKKLIGQSAAADGLASRWLADFEDFKGVKETEGPAIDESRYPHGNPSRPENSGVPDPDNCDNCTRLFDCDVEPIYFVPGKGINSNNDYRTCSEKCAADLEAKIRPEPVKGPAADAAALSPIARDARAETLQKERERLENSAGEDQTAICDRCGVTFGSDVSDMTYILAAGRAWKNSRTLIFRFCRPLHQQEFIREYEALTFAERKSVTRHPKND